jgi:hypothetical protein
MFYGIFVYMFKERETLDETFNDMKKYGGSQRKLVVIFKIWLGFWVNRGFGYMAIWSTHLHAYPYHQLECGHFQRQVLNL